MQNYQSGYYVPDFRNTFQYVVVSGDSLYSIAKKYNVTVEELVSLNHLTSNMIFPNQILFIPVKTVPNTYVTKAGDTIGYVINKYGLSLNGFWDLNNPLNLELAPNQTLKVALGTKPKYHTVEKNDSIEDILKKYGITPLELLNLNKAYWFSENTKIIVG